jgi:hypothetical protein
MLGGQGCVLRLAAQSRRLRMRGIFSASTNAPHPEPVPEGPSRRTHRRWPDLLAVYIALFLTITLSLAHAAPPAGADPDSELGRWFQSLKQPGSHVSCCSLSDCRITDYRAGKDGYEVLIDERVVPGATPQWLPVPAEAVLTGVSNPTGRAVVCAHATPEIKILCFVTPEET